MQKRFIQIKLKFLYKRLNNRIYCPELLQRINFKVNPVNHRAPNLFYIDYFTNNYLKNTPSNVLMSAENFEQNIDSFCESFKVFIQNVFKNTK